MAGGLAGAVCAGALKGAAIGAVSEALVYGTIEGITSVINKQSFWDGFVNGAADGFMFGTIIGAVVGGFSAYSSYGNFASAEKLQIHYDKHGVKMGYATSVEYAKDAKYVIRHGTKVVYQYKGKTTVGYVKFWSVERETNYVLVGMERTHTATFGIRRVSDLIDLGITLFVK